MSRADIANFLHLTGETVSRLLRRFQDDGVIQDDGREIEIRDCQRLDLRARCVLRPG